MLVSRRNKVERVLQPFSNRNNIYFCCESGVDELVTCKTAQRE